MYVCIFRINILKLVKRSVAVFNMMKYFQGKTKIFVKGLCIYGENMLSDAVIQQNVN